MVNSFCSLYRTPLPEFQPKLQLAIDRGCSVSHTPPQIFFRADDIGVPSTKFNRLIEYFSRHQLPLCLAAVPAWTTYSRLDELRKITGGNSSQWCWHQHGRLHRNFEQTGRKQEFGPARSSKELFVQLEKGKSRMQDLFGGHFTPVFTPPWNRCSIETLRGLVDLDFRAVSRNRNALPRAPSALPDFQVNVDLHTRKEGAPSLALANLLDEVEHGLASGLCGVMIHHQRMNESAFAFLDLLLSRIRADKRITPVHFGELIG